MTTDPDRLMRLSALWCVALGGLAAILVGLLRDVPSALGILVGVALGWANLWLLSRSLQKVLADPEAHRNQKKTPPVALLLKWPAMLAVVALVLLYVPVAPEGVAFGAILSLAAASIAALGGRKTPDVS